MYKKLTPTVVLLSALFLLTSCGKKGGNKKPSSEASFNTTQPEIVQPVTDRSNMPQRYTVHPVNEHHAVIVDQQTGKVIQLGFSDSSWNPEPKDLKIDWEIK